MKTRMRELRDGMASGYARNAERFALGEKRRIGPELEFPVVSVGTGRASSQKEIMSVFSEMTKLRSGWELADDGTSTGKVVDGYGISVGTDMGTGTMEISFPPVTKLRDAEMHVTRILNEVKPVAAGLGLAVLGYGVQPVSAPGNDVMMQKDRYHMLVKLLGPQVYAHTVTAASQVHMEVGIDELPGAINALNAASPAVIALTANSLVREGAPGKSHDSRVLSWDEAMTRDYAVRRIGIPDRMSCFEQYWEIMMDFAPFMTKRYGEYLMFDVQKTGTMREYIGRGSGTVYSIDGRAIGVSPEEIDVKMLQGTVWWEARATGYGTVEFRTPSLQPSITDILAVDAMALGLLENRDAVMARMKRYTHAQLSDARRDAAIRGFRGELAGEPLALVARDMLGIAESGLRSIGEDAGYLEPLLERLRDGMSPADRSAEILESKGLRAFLKDIRLRT